MKTMIVMILGKAITLMLLGLAYLIVHRTLRTLCP
jgi:hypothetical protein